MTRLHVLVPFWGLAGGVIKVLDYAEHGQRGGFNVTLWAPEEMPADPLLETLPVLERLVAANVARRRLDALSPGDIADDDLVLFTEPALSLIHI